MGYLEAFLAPVEGPDPAGMELRNDARFHALERLLEPAARANRLDSARSGAGGAVEVDWGGLLQEASELAGLGRDLRLLVIVARAAANDTGFAGLAAGLTLLTETVTRHWDRLHPALREAPSRREAAVRRINALFQIENEDNGLLGDLQFNVVLNPRGLGPIRGGDLAAGSLNRNAFLSEVPKGLGEKEQAARLVEHETRVSRVATGCRATLSEQPEIIESLANDLRGAQAALGALEQALAVQVAENGVGVKFNALGTFFSRVAATLAAAGDTASVTGNAAMAASAAVPNGADPPLAATVPSAAGGIQINSRRDVERSLDQIIAFYERTEPSSPIPHLARRLRKMVPMNFMQLMEEIAPSGMKEFRGVAGVFDEKLK